MQRAGEVARLGEIARGAQQHRRMPVMAAGMHLAGHGGGMGERVALVDVERVHIGAERDGAARPAALERADDAGAGEAAMDREAEPLELPGDEGGGVVLLEGGLGMGVDAPAPRRHVGVEIGDAVDDRHSHALARGSRVAEISDAPQCVGR